MTPNHKNLQEAYRMFRISKNRNPSTLFHGWNGRKELPLDIELTAKVAPVRNPGGGRLFDSGWHVVLTTEDMEKYAKKRFKCNDLVACRVLVSGIRNKPGSKILLANIMKIQSDDWHNALATR